MRTGRPPKAAKDRRDEEIKITLTPAEKKAIFQAAIAAGSRPITWSREMLLRAAAKRKATKK
jgi:hypothetical protein